MNGISHSSVVIREMSVWALSEGDLIIIFLFFFIIIIFFFGGGLHRFQYRRSCRYCVRLYQDSIAILQCNYIGISRNGHRARHPTRHIIHTVAVFSKINTECQVRRQNQLF